MKFQDIMLELVRPGPAHNQTLNRITPYIALCGESSPVTFNVNFQHAELLSRLEHLRYVVEHASGRLVPVASTIRQRELLQLGADMGTLLGEMRSLSTEISNLRTDNWTSDESEELIAHLRIVLSGSELAILPFELSIAPTAVPGEGSQLFLQSRVPLVPTREIRRSRPLKTRIRDFERVKVLYAYAAPGGTVVPAKEHLVAIRSALEPWLRDFTTLPGGPDAPDDEARLAELRKWIRVLPNASLNEIERICAEEHFSHVHLLAHGDTFTEAGETRYGIALCDPSDPHKKHVVPGQRLAQALTIQSFDRQSRSAPFWVTLASCDSGNPGSVLVPGGSLAHDLHASGIPWVLASQFPLTQTGSTSITQLLYEQLFAGEDPRSALYELRKRLYTHSDANHDWASVVVYASVPPDFDDDVSKFFWNVINHSISIRMYGIADAIDPDRADGNISPIPRGRLVQPETKQFIESLLHEVDELLDAWQRRLPRNRGCAPQRLHRANYLGQRAAVARWRAEIEQITVVGQDDPNEQDDQAEVKIRRLVADAARLYREAHELGEYDTLQYLWLAREQLAADFMLGDDLDPEVLAMFRACIRRCERDAAQSVDSRLRVAMAKLHLSYLEAAAREEPAPPDLPDGMDDLLDSIAAIGHVPNVLQTAIGAFDRYAGNLGDAGGVTPAWQDVARRIAERLRALH